MEKKLLIPKHRLSLFLSQLSAKGLSVLSQSLFEFLMYTTKMERSTMRLY